MSFVLRPFRCFPVQCAGTYKWTFLNLPLACFSGFGSSNGRTCINMPTQPHLLKRNSKNATQNEKFKRV